MKLLSDDAAVKEEFKAHVLQYDIVSDPNTDDIVSWSLSGERYAML